MKNKKNKKLNKKRQNIFAQKKFGKKTGNFLKEKKFIRIFFSLF